MPITISSNVLKQPWFWILAGVVAIVIGGVVLYYVGKSAGRAEHRTEFDKKQEELVKKAQESELRAQRAQVLAEESEKAAADLKEGIRKDRGHAAEVEQRVEADHASKVQEINQWYEEDKKFINSDLSTCDRCRDLCGRSNWLADTYGKDFASARCDVNVSCADACSDTAGQPKPVNP